MVTIDQMLDMADALRDEARLAASPDDQDVIGHAASALEQAARVLSWNRTLIERAQAHAVVTPP